MTPENGRIVNVFIVEDNPLDAQLVQMAMKEAELEFAAEIAGDGEVAIERLCLDGEGDSRRGPDLIILDLNLPKRDGTEVLQAIRGSEYLVDTPVVILSSSPDYVIEGKVHAAKVAADCYLTKPADLDEFLDLGKVIRQCYETKQYGLSRGASL